MEDDSSRRRFVFRIQIGLSRHFPAVHLHFSHVSYFLWYMRHTCFRTVFTITVAMLPPDGSLISYQYYMISSSWLRELLRSPLAYDSAALDWHYHEPPWALLHSHGLYWHCLLLSWWCRTAAGIGIRHGDRNGVVHRLPWRLRTAALAPPWRLAQQWHTPW